MGRNRSVAVEVVLKPYVINSDDIPDLEIAAAVAINDANPCPDWIFHLVPPSSVKRVPQ